MSIPELQNKYDLDGIDILFYNGVKLQINKWLKNQENRKFLNKEYKVDVNNALFVSNGHLLNLSNAKSRQFYNVIIDNKSEKPHSLCYEFSFWASGMQNYKPGTLARGYIR